MTNSTDQKAALAESRRRVQVLQVAAMQPGLSPDQLALLRNLERSQRAAVKACRKAVQHQESDDRRRLLEGRSKAQAALRNPDLPPEIKDLAKKAADHAEVALGLQDAQQRHQAPVQEAPPLPSPLEPTQQSQAPIPDDPRVSGATMSTQTRRFISAALLVLAIAAPSFCLDYGERQFVRVESHLIGATPRGDGPAPVITLRTMTQGSLVSTTGQHAVLISLTGYYPRVGMSFEAALIGGLVLPIIALIAACCLALTDIGAAWRYFWRNLAA